MDTLLRFGSGDELYTFTPDQQISLRDNFRDVVTRTSRLPGLSGGFDEYGTAPAPTEIGNVSVTFWLFADTKAEMELLKQGVGAMASYGVKQLYKSPVDGSTERYCQARVNSINYNENATDVPHRRLRVTVDFQVANPTWQTLGTEAWSWGDGTLWGGSAWGGVAAATNLIGTANTVSITPKGNGLMAARLTVSVPVGKSATGVTIQRLENAQVVHQVAYAGTLIALDEYEINCRALTVRKNGVTFYNADFSFLTAPWMNLAGGRVNSLAVQMTGVTDEINLTVRYYEVYR